MRFCPAEVIVYFVSVILGPALNSTAQTSTSAGAPRTTKTTEQVYKNIQVLKDVPADQLIPAMQFITASLGVQCDFCHLENAFDKDDKQPKQISRKMIQMMFALNKDNFQGQRRITCFACHRGARKPVTTPLIGDENRPLAKTELREQPQPADLPSMDRVFGHYRSAIGGPEATKISTRIQHGTLTVGTKSFPTDILSEAPDSRLTIVHFPDGEHVSALNAAGGWSSTPGRPVHNMGSTELQEGRLEAAIFFPANLRTAFGDLKLLRKGRINEKEMVIVNGNFGDSAPVELYFDAESGLLQRMVYYTETPLGTNPTQVDYWDYREQDGVKTPFQWTVSRPNRRFTIQIDETQQNVPINDSRLHSNLSNTPH